MNNGLCETWYRAELETVFNFVVKCGFVSKPLLAELFGIGSERSLRRFALAVDSSKLFDPLLSTPGFQGWHLSRSGKYVARSQGLKPSYPPRISSRKHDEMALSIAIQLEKSGLVSTWATEAQFIIEPSNRLMVTQDNRGQKYPDLVLTLREATMKIAVELELSRKSLCRYEKALNGYKAVRGIDILIFAVNSNAIRESIERAARHARMDESRLAILFAEAQSIHKNPALAHLEGFNWSGSFQTISEMKGAIHAA